MDKIVRVKQVARRVSAEVEANFAAWWRRNFVLGQDAGRIAGVSYTRAGELDDVCAGVRREDRALWYFDAYERGLIDRTEELRPDEFFFLLRNPLVSLQLALGVTDLRGLRCYRRGLAQEVARLQRRAYRGRYYARENARRRRLAAERRRITRRTTTNPCPTPEAFRAAFARRGESVEAKVRFGGMVQDLECYVDNCLRFDDRGEIVGRNGGVRAWIARNTPELACRYKTIMRYKAFVKRLRQAVGLADPVPTDAVLPPAEAATVPTDAVLPPTEAATVPTNAVLPPTEATTMPTDAVLPPASAVALPAADAARPTAGKTWPGGGAAGRTRGAQEFSAVDSRLWAEEILGGCANTLAEMFRRVDAALTEDRRSTFRAECDHIQKQPRPCIMGSEMRSRPARSSRA